MNKFHELNPRPAGQRVSGVHNGEKIADEKKLQKISEAIPEGSEGIRISVVKIKDIKIRECWTSR